MTRKQILPKFSYLGLLLFLVFFFILAPFFSKSEYARIVLDLSVICVLVFAVYICSDHKSSLVVALFMATPAFLRLLYPTIGVDEVTMMFNAGFLAFVIFVLLRRLFHIQIITLDVIYAAVTVYMLLGIFWGLTFTVLELFQNGSFGFPARGELAILGQDMLYYSFVTMTTVGYGDITPLSQPAKFLSILEAMMGQIYLTVLVARLVGLYTSQRNLTS
jgi:hypothetical protein